MSRIKHQKPVSKKTGQLHIERVVGGRFGGVVEGRRAMSLSSKGGSLERGGESL
jgi:hypothetical protein